MLNYYSIKIDFLNHFNFADKECEQSMIYFKTYFKTYFKVYFKKITIELVILNGEIQRSKIKDQRSKIKDHELNHFRQFD